jgi:hypothetical protein
MHGRMDINFVQRYMSNKFNFAINVREMLQGWRRQYTTGSASIYIKIYKHLLHAMVTRLGAVQCVYKGHPDAAVSRSTGER